MAASLAETLPLPTFKPPQRATLVSVPPRGEGWIYELKYDGYRCQAAISGRNVKLYTRSGLNWTKQFGFVVPELRDLTAGSLLIDGEIVAFDRSGRTSFGELQTALSTGAPISFLAFDLLEQDGKDLTRRPQLERKAKLQVVLGDRPLSSRLQFVGHIDAVGEYTPDVMFQAICQGGYEGMIAKKVSAPYRGDRSKAWLKIKCTKRQEFVIVGWRGPSYGVGVRSLIVATNEDGEWVYRGRVGTGFTSKMLDDLYRVLKPLEVVRSPLAKVPREAGRMVKWVKPQLVAEVAFAEVTADGSLRHPSFQGLRADKDPAEIVLERPAE